MKKRIYARKLNFIEKIILWLMMPDLKKYKKEMILVTVNITQVNKDEKKNIC